MLTKHFVPVVIHDFTYTVKYLHPYSLKTLVMVSYTRYWHGVWRVVSNEIPACGWCDAQYMARSAGAPVRAPLRTRTRHRRAITFTARDAYQMQPRHIRTRCVQYIAMNVYLFQNANTPFFADGLFRSM